ncbi:hypothetical protein TNCV_3509431 [Trichonephila clavipes]|nr:hypothetical protein TNCV_3509431 [Trichonephila clavipes]
MNSNYLFDPARVAHPRFLGRSPSRWTWGIYNVRILSDLLYVQAQSSQVSEEAGVFCSIFRRGSVPPDFSSLAPGFRLSLLLQPISTAVPIANYSPRFGVLMLA